MIRLALAALFHSVANFARRNQESDTAQKLIERLVQTALLPAKAKKMLSKENAERPAFNEGGLARFAALSDPDMLTVKNLTS